MSKRQVNGSFASTLGPRQNGSTDSPLATPADQELLSLRNELVDFILGDGSIDDPEFKDKADRMVALGVALGVNMKTEITGLMYLARTRRWMTESEIREVTPSAVMRMVN